MEKQSFHAWYLTYYNHVQCALLVVTQPGESSICVSSTTISTPHGSGLTSCPNNSTGATGGGGVATEAALVEGVPLLSVATTDICRLGSGVSVGTDPVVGLFLCGRFEAAGGGVANRANALLLAPASRAISMALVFIVRAVNAPNLDKIPTSSQQETRLAKK